MSNDDPNSANPSPSPGHRLSDSDERFRLFMECVQDYAIFMLDAGGRVREWNAGAERILGYSEAEIIGRHFVIFFPPEAGSRGERELQTAAAHGRASDEGWHIRKDGLRFWASGVTTALRDENGALKGFAKVMRNLTERKNLEEELRLRAEALAEADRRKDEFLAMLAHELRNPLAPIFNVLHLMKLDQSATSAQQQARDMLDRQVRHLAHLVDDLLDVSRITRGKIRLTTRRMKLSDIIEHAVQTAQPQIEARKHHFSISEDSDPIWLDADPARLAQVLSNLLINAAKYTPPEGRIELAACQEGDWAVMRVTDTGVGLAPEMIPRIFDLFAQADHTLARSQGGLGVGLTLARSLVELHGGKLEALSRGSGQGSQFIVRIPMPADAPTHEDAAVIGTVPVQLTHTLRVLVVDDNEDAAESLSLLLRMNGYDVQLARDGSTALTMANAYQPQFILLDIGLPGMDGFQVAARLREQSSLNKTVLIALTGYGQESDKVRGKAAGFDYHLVKPVDPQKLQELLTMLAYQNGTPQPSSTPEPPVDMP